MIIPTAREEASHPVTARAQAPQRPREDSPPGTSPSASSAGEESQAAPPRSVAVAFMPAGHGTAGNRSTAERKNAADDGSTAERRDTPDDDESFLEIIASLTAPSQARHHVRATLARWKLPPEATSDALMIVSEFTTNAIAACGIAPDQPEPDANGPVTLKLRRQPGQLVIEVTDPNPDPPAPAEPELDAESGRGLMLVQELSAQWGYRPAPCGKTVFAVLALPA